VELRLALIPTYPTAGSVARLAVALDDGAPQVVEMRVKDGGTEWAQGVLDNMRVVHDAGGGLEGQGRAAPVRHRRRRGRGQPHPGRAPRVNYGATAPAPAAARHTYTVALSPFGPR
jgi:hypothetical protein